MKPPPKIEAEGLRVYEQVCAFERLRQRRMPVIYCFFPLLLAVFGIGMLIKDQPELAVGSLLAALMFAVVATLNWRRLSQRYAENLNLLTELEGTYGEDLPWVKVERHFAALEQLKRDLAEEERRSKGAADRR